MTSVHFIYCQPCTFFFLPLPSSFLFLNVEPNECWEEKYPFARVSVHIFHPCGGEFTCTLQDEWLEQAHWEMAVVKQYKAPPSSKQLNGQVQKKWMGGVKRPTAESNCRCVHRRERKQPTKRLVVAHHESNISNCSSTGGTSSITQHDLILFKAWILCCFYSLYDKTFSTQIPVLMLRQAPSHIGGFKRQQETSVQNVFSDTQISCNVQSINYTQYSQVYKTGSPVMAYTKGDLRDKAGKRSNTGKYGFFWSKLL